MKKIHSTFFKKGAALMLAFAAAAIASQPVFADTTGETKASVTFTKGELALVSTPNLNFGEHKIDSAATRFQSTVDTAVRISDARGTGEGWELGVDMSAFTLAGQPTLQGAKIELVSPAVVPVEGTPDRNPPHTAADESTGILTIASGGGEAILLESGTGQGMGVWELLLAADSTTLVTLPGTAQVHEGGDPSVATMEWTLRAAP